MTSTAQGGSDEVCELGSNTGTVHVQGIFADKRFVCKLGAGTHLRSVIMTANMNLGKRRDRVAAAEGEKKHFCFVL